MSFEPAKNPLIKAAEVELEALLKEDTEIEARRSALQQKIAVVSQTLETLRRVYAPTDTGVGVFGELINANLGITDQIRGILKSEYPVYLKPTTIRDYLEHYNSLKTKDGKDYENPLALVHQILKRLDVAGEVETQSMADGGKMYRWIPPTASAALAKLVSDVKPNFAASLMNARLTPLPGSASNLDILSKLVGDPAKKK